MFPEGPSPRRSGSSRILSRRGVVHSYHSTLRFFPDSIIYLENELVIVLTDFIRCWNAGKPHIYEEALPAPRRPGQEKALFRRNRVNAHALVMRFVLLVWSRPQFLLRAFAFVLGLAWVARLSLFPWIATMVQHPPARDLFLESGRQDNVKQVRGVHSQPPPSEAV